jgi:hypothetical protein
MTPQGVIMFGTQTELIVALRSMALQGSKPSEMLHAIIACSTSEGVGGLVDRNLLVQYFSEAFCFSDGQAYPIFGWLPDGTGELKGPDIDSLLTKRIHQTRGEWGKSS